MDSAENFSLHDLFTYGFPLNSNIAGNGNMELSAKKFHAEDTYLMKPVGKSLIINLINFTCRQPLGHITKWKKEHSYAGLFHRNSEDNMGGGT